MGHLRLALTACFGVAAGAGCVLEPGAEAVEELKRSRAAADETILALGELEERFLYNQMKLSLWRELAYRHKQVSEIACSNAEVHATGINAFEARQTRKLAQASRPVRRRAPASVSGGAAAEPTSSAGEPTSGAW